MENKHYPSGDTSDREIVLSRVFDAPRELVFEVWTLARMGEYLKKTGAYQELPELG